MVELDGFESASTVPALSPTGSGIAFLQMKENEYEVDKIRSYFALISQSPPLRLSFSSRTTGRVRGT